MVARNLVGSGDGDRLFAGLSWSCNATEDLFLVLDALVLRLVISGGEGERRFDGRSLLYENMSTWSMRRFGDDDELLHGARIVGTGCTAAAYPLKMAA